MRTCAWGELTGAECTKSIGGVIRTAGIKRSDVTDVTFDANGQVTALTLTAAGAFKSVTWADNNVATFVESPNTRESDLKVGTFTANLYGINNAYIKWADDVSACCEGVILIHEMGDGSLRVQGIEYMGSTGTTWRYSVGKTLVFTGTDHGTIETKPMTTVTAESRTMYHAPYVAPALTYAAILAL